MKIRLYLLSLVVALAVPLVALLGLRIHDGRQQAILQAQSMMANQAAVMATNVERKLTLIRHQLQYLAGLPAVAQFDPAQCPASLAPLLDLHPEYTNIVSNAPDGTTICTALPFPPGLISNVSTTAWHQNLLRTQRFSISEPYYGRIAKKDVLLLSQPVRDAGGSYIGSVSITIALTNFDPQLPKQHLPDGLRYGFFNDDGALMWRNVDMAGNIGRRIGSEAARRILEVREGSFRVSTQDGVERFYVAKPLPEFGLIAFVGLPVDTILAAARRTALVEGLLAMAAITLLLILAFRVARRIEAPVVDLERAARSIRHGDIETRAKVSGPAEIAHLAAEFNALHETRLAIEQELKGQKAELENYRQSLESQVEARTEEVQAVAAALRAANEEQQALFAAASVGIVYTRARCIQRCNPTLEQQFGYEPGAMIGQATRSWYPDEATYVEVGQAIVTALRERRLYREDRELLRRDGSSFWARITVQWMDRTDPDKGQVGVIEDITTERQAFESLAKAKLLAEDAARTKSDFVANMSHEIRTPMNAVIGLTHLALQTPLSDKQRDYLQKIHSSSQHLLRIINDILDFSKIEAGKMVIEHIEFHLEQVLDHVIALVADKAAAKGLELIIEIGPDVPLQLVGDPVRIG